MRKTKNQILDSFPIEGRTITTDKGTWTARVVDAKEKVTSYGFVVRVRFEGNPVYRSDIHLDPHRLTQSAAENEQEIELILQDVLKWLETDPPPGTKEFL